MSWHEHTSQGYGWLWRRWESHIPSWKNSRRIKTKSYSTLWKIMRRKDRRNHTYQSSSKRSWARRAISGLMVQLTIGSRPWRSRIWRNDDTIRLAILDGTMALARSMWELYYKWIPNSYRGFIPTYQFPVTRTDSTWFHFQECKPRMLWKIKQELTHLSRYSGTSIQFGNHIDNMNAESVIEPTCNLGVLFDYPRAHLYSSERLID